MHPSLRFAISALFLSASLPLAAAQGIPSGYYDSVDASDPTTLRATLHDVIDDHTRFPYTSGSTDTWNVLEAAQEDPSNPSRILDIYRNESFAKMGGGNSSYDREHSWPRSYGYPNDGASNYPFTDCHALFLCRSTYNNSRGNKPYRDCSSGCSEWVTLANDGLGGGSGTYPGNSNWTSGSSLTGSWQTWSGRQGDVARALLYFDVRYEGGFHGVTGVSEPDLVLTNNLGLIGGSSTGSNESVAYMGMLDDLLAWHAADPPDAFEQQRNDVVASFQGNRNPFVDHPEWVDCIFSDGCSEVPTFFLGANTFSAATGGLLSMTVDVGSDFAGQSYWILGSVSGTAPGFPLGGFQVPLNLDFYLNLTLSLANQAPFLNSLGVLGAGGDASAFFFLGAGAATGLVGFDLSHAAVVFDPVTESVETVTTSETFSIIP